MARRRSTAEEPISTWSSFRKRNQAVVKNSRSSKRSAPRRQIPLDARAGPAKEGHHNQATVVEFDREQMGIAAKE